KQDQQDALGTVTAATAERIEIQLDQATSLDRWGGAPVLAADGGRVIGILEAALPSEGTARVLAAPIGGVPVAPRPPPRARKGAPLDAGKGRRFAELAPGVQPPEPGAAAARSDGHKLIQPTAGKATNLELSIEYPSDGAQVSSSACGTFVAGRAQATRGSLRRFDVILVIDTSGSTLGAAGTDVNENGVVGQPRLR